MPPTKKELLLKDVERVDWMAAVDALLDTGWRPVDDGAVLNPFKKYDNKNPQASYFTGIDWEMLKFLTTLVPSIAIRVRQEHHYERISPTSVRIYDKWIYKTLFRTSTLRFLLEFIGLGEEGMRKYVRTYYHKAPKR